MKNFLFITKSGFFSPDKLSRLMYPKETDKVLIIFSIDLFLKSLNLWYCTVLYCTVQDTYNVFKSHINFPSLFLFNLYFKQYLKNFVNNNLNIF